MSSSTHQKHAVWAVVATQLITGSTYLVAKLGLRELHPFTLGFLRFVITGTVYLLLFQLLANRVRPLRQLNVRLLTLMGFLAVPLNQALFLYGQRLSHSSHGALLYALTPLIVIILARLFLSEQLTVWRIIGVGLGLGGALLVLFENSASFSADSATGDLLIFLGVLVWAAYTILLKRALVTHSALEATGWSLILGAVLFLPIGIPAMLTQDFHHVSLTAWASVIYLSLLTSVLAYFVWSWALSYVEAGRIAVVSNLQPVVATVLAWMFLNEPITMQFLVGTGLTITGVMLTQNEPL